MERYETPGVEVTTPLEVTLMAQAMAMLEAGIWTSLSTAVLWPGTFLLLRKLRRKFRIR